MPKITFRPLISAAAWLGLAALIMGCASGEHPPDAPTGLKAMAGNRSVTLTWDGQQDVQYYTLLYSESAGVGESANKIKNATSPYRHTALQNGVTLYYRLMATNENGNSPLSQEVSASPVLSATAPGAPASVTATPGDGQVSLTWGAVSGASKYTIYRDTNTGVMPGTGTVLDNVTSPRADTGLTNGNTYYYVVTATIQGVESLPSAEVYGTPKASGSTLSPPASLNATAGDKQVTLTWPSVTGATSYTLYWATSTGVTKTTGTAIASATSPYTHTGLTNGTPYYYVVTATKGTEESKESPEASATPADSGTTVSPPVYLAAVAGDKQITLTWGAVTGATTYTVYWSTSTGVTKTTGTAIASATSPYTHTGLTNGTPYYYVVTATKGALESKESTEASATPKATGTAPSAPTNLVAVSGAKQVTLSWSPSSGATSYTLYWATSTGVTKKTGAAIAGASSPKKHPGLTNGVTYYYVVTASNTYGESVESLEASAKPQGGISAPAAPTNLKAGAGDKKITLSWSPSSGATSYTLYWSFSSTVSQSTGTAVSKATTPYTHSPLTNGTTYYYVVTAENSAGQSPDSNKASATPKGSSTGNGTILSTLTGGAYAVVLLENTYANKGIIQVHVYTSDPLGVPAGKGISGLSIVASGAASGKLSPTATTGVYQGQTSSLLTSGTYGFSISGATSGTVSATVKVFPTCTVTSPTSGSYHKAGTDLTVKWTSTNSQKAQITLKDNMGTVLYPPLKPDPGGVIVPGKDIPYTGILDILASAVWSVKATANNAGLIAMGDGFKQVVLN